MRILRRLAFIWLVMPTAAWAEPASEATSQDVSAEPVPPTEVKGASPVWVAGLHGGMIERDRGAASPYATLSVTRFHGQAYVRAAVTAYRSTLRQPDAALPSTYYIGSLGAGGNFDDWLIDAHLSYGRQAYGLVETGLGKRRSEIAGTDYAAAGIRAGRVFRPAPRWYVTPTLAVQYVDTQSLRHRVEAGRPFDFEVRERAWTGSASVRVDRTFGASEQNFVGVSLSHNVSDNGLTQLSAPSPLAGVSALRTPDGWQEVEASGTIRLRPGLWLDGQVQRSFGAVAGNSTTMTLGLRLRL